jgi:hypothetical protein
VITAVIIASSGYIHAALHGSTIVSDGSVIQRLNQWGCVFHMITKNSGNLFFGTGMTQGLTSFNGATLLIDNSFLAITLQTGIFGLFAYVLISYMLYLHMLNGIITLSPESSGNAEEILKMATASFYSTWLALAFINLNFIFPYVIFMIYKMCGIKKMKKKLSPVDICSYS